MRKLRLKNKKAAFEMSITTIVILVIALTMLIFGMIFVRKMMCSSMDLMEGVTAGTKTEISKLFSTTGGEVICLGEGEKIQDIFPSGTVQNAYCGFNVESGASKTFPIVVDENSITVIFEGLTDAQAKTLVKNWVTPVAKSSVSAKAGTQVIAPVFYMNIPKDAPVGFFSINVKVGETDHFMQFNIKRAGAVQSAIC